MYVIVHGMKTRMFFHGNYNLVKFFLVGKRMAAAMVLGMDDFYKGGPKNQCINLVGSFKYDLPSTVPYNQHDPVFLGQRFGAAREFHVVSELRLGGHQSAVFLLIYEIEMSQVVTNVHHHIKT